MLASPLRGPPIDVLKDAFLCRLLFTNVDEAQAQKTSVECEK